MIDINLEILERAQKYLSENSLTKQTIDILVLSINDWPDPIITLDAFEFAVKTFIGGEVTKRQINKCKIVVSKDAWKAESLSQLVDIFSLYDDGISLREIIYRLKCSLSENYLCNLT